MDKEELQEQYETWIGHPLTIRLLNKIEAEKNRHFQTLAHASVQSDLNKINVTGGRIQGLQDAHALIAGKVTE